MVFTRLLKILGRGESFLALSKCFVKSTTTNAFLTKVKVCPAIKIGTTSAYWPVVDGVCAESLINYHTVASWGDDEGGGGGGGGGGGSGEMKSGAGCFSGECVCIGGKKVRCARPMKYDNTCPSKNENYTYCGNVSLREKIMANLSDSWQKALSLASFNIFK